MTTSWYYALSEIIINASTPPCSSASRTLVFDSGSDNDNNAAADDESFDKKLHDKLLLRTPKSATIKNNNTDKNTDDTTAIITFDTVRSLFGTAAQALHCEIEDQCRRRRRHRHDEDASCKNSIQAQCHWIPGRIEVMGKHTDYAGGNSLVCATDRRGMAFVSSFIDDKEVVDADNGNDDDGKLKRRIKVTIVSVVPPTMEDYANKKTSIANTTAPYKVDGRTVVRHTLIVSGEQIHVVREEDGDWIETTTTTTTTTKTYAKDWTIYPTAVIKRLHHNFGLFPRSRGAGGHLIIAISSNLPPASGLSTSSALVTGMFLAVDSHFHLSTLDRFRNAIGDEKDKTTLYNLSTYLGNIENGRDYIHNGVVLEGTVDCGVGTFGGSEDHAAILLGERGDLRLLSFCPTRPACIERISVISDLLNNNQEEERDVELYPIVGEIDSVIRLPTDVTFVIAYSGVKAEKAGGADGDSVASVGYNSASELARCALNAYLTVSGCNDSSEGIDDIQTLADAVRWERKHLPSASFSDIRCEISRHIMAGEDRGEEYSKLLVQRFAHYYNESEYFVPAAAYALSQKKYDLLGQVVDASHRGAVNSLKNQTEETAWLPLWARGKEHTLQLNSLFVTGTQNGDIETNTYRRIKALAASAFGAGYGGSCWALVYRHEAHEFARQWQAAFEERFPQSKQCRDVLGEFFVTDPGPGAFRV